MSSKLLEKAAKILRLAENAGTAEESAAAMSRLHALMSKHNLDMMEIRSKASDNGSKELFNDDDFAEKSTKTFNTPFNWVEKALAHYVDEICGTKSVIWERRRRDGSRNKRGYPKLEHEITFFGLEGDAAVASRLWIELRRSTKRLFDEWWDNHQHFTIYPITRCWNDWYSGFFTGLQTQIDRSKKTVQQAAEFEGKFELLVLKDQLVAQQAKKQYPALRTSRATGPASFGDGGGFIAGREAGLRMDLDTKRRLGSDGGSE